MHPLGSGHRLLAATPDGDALVYTTEVGGDLVLALRSLAPGGPGRGPLQEPVARIIPGTEGGFAPFLSPDGAWLGFSTGTHLMKIPLQGGSVAVPIAEVRNVQGAVWGPDRFPSCENIVDT